MKKIILFASIFFLLAFSSIASAQSTIYKPEFNPLCWTKDECTKARKLFTLDITEKAEEGWVKNQTICPGEKWGMCLPTGKTTTKISFGGKSSFVHIGDYILTVYNYAISVVGIIAVLVIIIASLQWLTSGGNSETIGRAKKRIGGAIIGLFIAYGSYFILNTINPALISLRLPQVYMIKKQVMAGKYCKDLDPDTMVVLAGKTSVKTDITKLKSVDYSLRVGTAIGHEGSTDKSKTKLDCGNKYFINQGGNATCLGHYCEVEGAYKSLCLEDTSSASLSNPDYVCEPGTIAGFVMDSNFVSGAPATFSNGWGNPPIIFGGVVGSIWNFKPFSSDPNSYGELLVVCKEAKTHYISIMNKSTLAYPPLEDGRQPYNFSYQFSDLLAAHARCTEYGGMKGLVLVLSFNNPILGSEPHAIGKNGVDLGDFAYSKTLITSYPGFFTTYMNRIDSSYLFSMSEVLDGVLLNLDMADITRMNGRKYIMTGKDTIDFTNPSANYKETYGYLIGNSF
ncbi:MAG: hypothetical protein ABIH87_00220 [bacterium]